MLVKGDAAIEIGLRRCRVSAHAIILYRGHRRTSRSYVSPVQGEQMYMAVAKQCDVTLQEKRTSALGVLGPTIIHTYRCVVYRRESNGFRRFDDEPSHEFEPVGIPHNSRSILARTDENTPCWTGGEAVYHVLMTSKNCDWHHSRSICPYRNSATAFDAPYFEYAFGSRCDEARC